MTDTNSLPRLFVGAWQRKYVKALLKDSIPAQGTIQKIAAILSLYILAERETCLASNQTDILPRHAEIKNNDLLIKKLCDDPRYQIFDGGTVLTQVQKTGKISKDKSFRPLSPKTSKEGYVTFRYQYKYLAIHRIVFQKFIGDLDFTKQINHKDGNPKNNHASNLELVTQSENGIHSFRVLNRKPNRGFAKITFDQAEHIRFLRECGYKYKQISDIYGITKATISSIIQNKTWKPEREAS